MAEDPCLRGSLCPVRGAQRGRTGGEGGACGNDQEVSYRHQARQRERRDRGGDAEEKASGRVIPRGETVG